MVRHDVDGHLPEALRPFIDEKAELKLGGGKLEGVLTVVEMGMSAGVSGVKK